MPNSYFSNPLMFLIETLSQLYMYIVAIRLLLPLIRTSFTHPLIQTIIRITEPLCAPLRSFMPSTRKFDSAVLLLLILGHISQTDVVAESGGGMARPHWLGPADCCRIILTVYQSVYGDYYY